MHHVNKYLTNPFLYQYQKWTLAFLLSKGATMSLFKMPVLIFNKYEINREYYNFNNIVC